MSTAKLTPAELAVLTEAVAYYETVLEDRAPRKVRTLNSAWRKIQEQNGRRT